MDSCRADSPSPAAVSGPHAVRLSYVLHGRALSASFRGPRVLIGRATDCDLVLPLSHVSRRHATIEKSGDGWTLADCGSKTGTSLNGRPVTRAPLADGDRITLAPALESAASRMTRST